MPLRKVEYRLYPSARQEAELLRVRAVAAECYNLALRERRWRFEEWGLSTSFAEQCAGLKFWRTQKPAWAAVHTHVLQVALKRLDLAFAAFFRRVAAGEEPGYPRLKRAERLGGFGFKEHGNGFWLEGRGKKGCRVRLSGIGTIQARGRARFSLEGAQAKTIEIVERAGKWFATVSWALSRAPARERQEARVGGLDWGLETFATLASVSEQDAGQPVPKVAGGAVEMERIENPRHLRQSLKALRREQRALSRKQRGSRRRELQRQRVARLHEQVAARRRDFLHQTTSRLAVRFGVLAVEKLAAKAMSAGGGARKRGLNRELLAASAGAFHTMLACKAEEAGGTVVWVEPREAAPTQTCCESGQRTKKPLGQRWHELPDGRRLSRDENAARVLLGYALRAGKENPRGREPAQRGGGSLEPPMKRETPFQAHAWAA